MKIANVNDVLLYEAIDLPIYIQNMISKTRASGICTHKCFSSGNLFSQRLISYTRCLEI